MSKLLLFASISIILTACGGGKSTNTMSDKKYIVVTKDIPKGICESQLYRSTLEGYGLEGVLTEETDRTTNCKTYGKSNDNKFCVEEYYGEGNVNCVVGFNNYNGSTDIHYRETNKATKLDLYTIGTSLSELLTGSK